ncbi:PorP/SprF family type IX secretion system membrane protein [Fulvivirga sp. 29W222]|uniref:PorP/SprF family type IX secretion system membrane protein n=1 Tax=Fulvivirga marina TaxID=2494733 RepID=A0A937FTL1_9BACT|nr:PorP/SprF family type IX secretion system membrane protein [Fulvivirga marina]MBL6445675.1 PorP/SprF family type IX secretion system membrane protein [Fulvivirga marina]
MRNFNNIFLIVSTLLVGVSGQAQQLGLNNFYNQNLYLINPASVGMDNCFRGFINQRMQWSGVNNAPATTGITMDSRVFKAHGLGLNLQMVNAGLLSQVSGKLSYAYHIKIAKESSLHAGVSGGINYQRFNLDDVVATSYSDRILMEQNQNGSELAIGTGLMFTSPHLKLGVALPQPINLAQKIGSGERANMYASYQWFSSPTWMVETSVLYRSLITQNDQIETGARARWKNIIGMGMIYRSHYGMVAMAELMLNDKFSMAYSFDFGGKNTTGVSHGIMLGIKLCRKSSTQAIPDSAPVNPSPKLILEESKPTQVVSEPEPDSVRTLPEEAPAGEVAPEVDQTSKLQSANLMFGNRDQFIRFENESDSKVISDNQFRVITQVVQILNEEPAFKVKVIGHASSSGDEAFNLQLSEKRAQRIANSLLEKGIDPSRVISIGKGEKEPIADNSTKQGASENRRVQIVFYQ